MGSGSGSGSGIFFQLSRIRIRVKKNVGSLSLKIITGIHHSIIPGKYYYGFLGSLVSFIITVIILYYVLTGRGERIDIG